MNQRGFSFKKCMVGLVLAIAMVIQTPVSGFAADVCTQSNVVQAEGKVSKAGHSSVQLRALVNDMGIQDPFSL